MRKLIEQKLILGLNDHKLLLPAAAACSSTAPANIFGCRLQWCRKQFAATSVSIDASAIGEQCMHNVQHPL
jgi:hypothetical protein